MNFVIGLLLCWLGAFVIGSNSIDPISMAIGVVILVVGGFIAGTDT